MRKIQDPHHFVKDLAEVPAQVPAKTLQVLTRDPSNPCLSDPNKDILDPFRGTSGPRKHVPVPRRDPSCPIAL